MRCPRCDSEEIPGDDFSLASFRCGSQFDFETDVFTQTNQCVNAAMEIRDKTGERDFDDPTGYDRRRSK